jgi:rubrerythrin
VKYLLYADHARKSGNKELADLFEKTAHTERYEHFAEQAQLVGLVGSDIDNLNDAIKGESYEVDTMYLEFARKAKVAGDAVAATRFEEVRHVSTGTNSRLLWQSWGREASRPMCWYETVRTDC